MTTGTSGTYSPAEVITVGVQLNTGMSGADAGPVTFIIDSFSIAAARGRRRRHGRRRPRRWRRGGSGGAGGGGGGGAGGTSGAGRRGRHRRRRRPGTGRHGHRRQRRRLGARPSPCAARRVSPRRAPLASASSDPKALPLPLRRNQNRSRHRAAEALGRGAAWGARSGREVLPLAAALPLCGATFSSRYAATQNSGAFQLMVTSFADQASPLSMKHFCGAQPCQPRRLHVRDLRRAGVRAARQDARRRRRILRVRLETPEAVVRVLQRAVAVAGDVALVGRRCGPARSPCPWTTPFRYLPSLGEVVRQRDDQRVVDHERIGPPRVAVLRHAERQPVALLWISSM